MKLHLAAAGSRHAIDAYAADAITVSGVAYNHSILLTAETVAPWTVASPLPLDESLLDFFPLKDIGFVIIGTGSRYRLPSRNLFAHFRKAAIGIEIMDTGAACRTFNLVVADGRPVLAALYLEKL